MSSIYGKKKQNGNVMGPVNGMGTTPVDASSNDPITAPAVVYDNAALVKRCRANAFQLGWKIPFFLAPLAHIEFRADQRIRTACVHLNGVIRVSPAFAETLKDPELQFVIAHEMMHLLLLHHDRRGHREPNRFNVATDLIINRTLKNVADKAGAGSFTMPKVGIIADDDQAEMTAEQLYQTLPDQPQLNGLDPAQIQVGNGCGALPSDGDSVSLNQATIEALKRRWRETAAQAQMQGRDAGTLEGNILADALDLPQPKVRWQEVLRGALSRAREEAGKDDVTWSRRSRRSTPEIILPGGTTYRCKGAVVIDSSGSMSDEDLARAVTETEAIVNHMGVPVFLVVHDHCVQAAVWIKPGGRGAVRAQIQKRIIGRGGTSFDEAYAVVEAEPTKFNVMVHATDGEIYGTWPNKPPSVRRLVVALLGSKSKADIPHDARVVDVEI
jgi:predicted metal-dependent peptidase